jgi:beta-glucosidase
LWQRVASVKATVKNSGSVAGEEVAQLYIGIPGAPLKQLRGFEKVKLAPGQSAGVEFALTRRDLSEWDVATQQWVLQDGKYRVFVGASSRDIRLTGWIKVAKAS